MSSSLTSPAKSKEKLKPEVLAYRFSYNISGCIYGGMAELVDALDLGSSVERRDGFESLYLHQRRCFTSQNILFPKGAARTPAPDMGP